MFKKKGDRFYMLSNIEAFKKMRILRMLAYYSCLNTIIRKDPTFYRSTRDQYDGDSVEERKELTLGGILFALSDIQEFIVMLDNLNEWICRYPEYQTKSFGKKLTENIFNFYSEIEIFHYLKEKEIHPVLNPLINSKSGKNLDFDIYLDSKRYFIEVLTPRMSKELEKEFESEDCGFYDRDMGLGPKNKEPYSRVKTLIVEEIAKHIEISSETVDAPIILVINNTYANWEVPGTQNPFSSMVLPNFICGILFYDRHRGSNFFANPDSRLADKEIQFFEKLID
jgi:hypothetical protein